MKYVFALEFDVLERKKILDDEVILIDEDTPIDEEYMGFFQKRPNLRVTILGLWRNSTEVYVNLLDLSHLKKNIQSALNRKKTNMEPLLLVKDVEQRIKSLFEPHGEKSLYDLLNKTRQAIVSGTDLFKQGLLNRKEYLESYMGPGLECWEAFERRLKKYEEYLRVCGFESELEKINRNIRNFQRFIDELSPMKEDQIKKMREAVIKLNKDYLEQIDNNLTGMKRRIDAVYESS